MPSEGEPPTEPACVQEKGSTFMGYDGKLSDINTERTIPAGTEVSVVLSEPAQVANTKADGSGSPKIELVFKVANGPFANFRIREQLWISTIAKEGKEKPPWETQARPTIAKIYKGYVPVPKPTYGNAGEETPESKAIRAPILAKMDLFLAGVKSPDDVAARLSTFTGKQCKVKVGIETFNNRTKNVINEYFAA